MSKTGSHQIDVTVEIETAAGPRALTADDTGKVFSNEGAAGLVGFTLPEPTAGMHFSFIVQNANGIQIDAAGGDSVSIAGSVGVTISAVVVGNTVDLVAINATDWVALSNVGTWTVTPGG